MIRNLLYIFILFFLTGCTQDRNKLEVKFLRVDTANTEAVTIHGLEIKNADSVFYKTPRYHYTSESRLKFDSLPDGEYEIKFLDILNKRKVRKFSLKDDESKIVEIAYDSIDIHEFIDKAPISNLKDGESYRVETKGGCVATMYGYYIVTKKNDSTYFEAPYRKLKKLTKDQIKAIRKFEAELLAINGVDVCMSTGRMHYKIIVNGKVIEITDNTCNWSGWNTMMYKIPVDED